MKKAFHKIRARQHGMGFVFIKVLTMTLNSEGAQVEILSGSQEQLDETDLETVKLAVYILVGAVLEGSEELARQMKSKMEEPTPPSIFRGPKIPGETSADLLRFALMGFFMDSSARVSRALSTVGQASNKASGWLFSALKPVTHSRLMRPVRRGFDQLVTNGEELVESWIDTGRVREKESRAMARQAAAILVDDFLEYLSTNEGVQELVQEQGISMTGEALAEMRKRSANADEFAEQIFQIILRRRSQPEKQIDQPDGSTSIPSENGDIG